MHPVFIGDEITAQGYRLAGALVRIPEPREVESALEGAVGQSEIIFITAEFAAMVSEGTLRRLLAALTPQLVIVPDVRGRVPLPDLSQALRASLGVQL
jgi:vacuolar-type H+-ATPase subunit F/Vma7